MITHKDLNKPFWIAHNPANSVVRFGKLTVGQLQSGQPEFESFSSFEAWENRLNELGVTLTDEHIQKYNPQ